MKSSRMFNIINYAVSDQTHHKRKKQIRLMLISDHAHFQLSRGEGGQKRRNEKIRRLGHKLCMVHLML